MKIGISPFDYWNYTFFEISMMYNVYVENKKEEMKMNTIATRNAIYSFMEGISIDEIYNDNNNEDDEIENNGINYIDEESKRQQLEELKALLLNETT